MIYPNVAIYFVQSHLGECASSTKAKEHLKLVHKTEFKEVEGAEKIAIIGTKRKATPVKSVDTKQMKLLFSPEKKYSADHWK